MLSGIKKISGIEDVTEIGANAFTNSKVEDFTWPEKCPVIPHDCFYGCKNLRIAIKASCDSFCIMLPSLEPECIKGEIDVTECDDISLQAVFPQVFIPGEYLEQCANNIIARMRKSFDSRIKIL